ncbi:MAG: NADH-quinone oxidoreductase subunit M, partial [Actinomycetota bacterium]|nr:NADH-quinone oxidoreductase subunit M [Actinomycetota bacterium]
MGAFHLSILVFLPLVAGLVGAFTPTRVSRWLVTAATVVVLGIVVAMIVDFDKGSGGLHYVTDDGWISELGIRYSLGVDGLNLFLLFLTAVGWVFAAVWSTFHETERVRLYFFHLALAETAVLGAFCAQDLALFVIFFDLMLVPFYFLVGGWGNEETRVAATTKFVIYTLVGSLLMLAGAVALGALSAADGQSISFSLAELEKRSLPGGTQNWIFLLFAAAFLIKAPVFPLHGWVPDTYRSSSIPVLILVGAVLSKVGVYGFLRVVVPILPDAAQHYQTLIIVIAVVSIIYGSVLAFTQLEARLVVAYSSIAQMGFIVLGIFALDPKGAQGAVMQMVTHGLVIVPLFFIIAALTVRAGGSGSLERMGGAAFGAPVLATLFLVITLATLAMPGSPNFVGEFLILFGIFEDKLVFGLVASTGVVLAAVYMIRVFQRSMHNRVTDGVQPREAGGLELAMIAPVAAVIVALGVYPQLLLDRSEEATVSKVREAGRLVDANGDAAAAEQVPPAPSG